MASKAPAPHEEQPDEYSTLELVEHDPSVNSPEVDHFANSPELDQSAFGGSTAHYSYLSQIGSERNSHVHGLGYQQPPIYDEKLAPEVVPTPAAAADAPRKRSRTNLYILVLALVLILAVALGVGLGVGLKSRSSNDQASAAPATSTR